MAVVNCCHCPPGGLSESVRCRRAAWPMQRMASSPSFSMAAKAWVTSEVEWVGYSARSASAYSWSRFCILIHPSWVKGRSLIEQIPMSSPPALRSVWHSFRVSGAARGSRGASAVDGSTTGRSAFARSSCKLAASRSLLLTRPPHWCWSSSLMVYRVTPESQAKLSMRSVSLCGTVAVSVGGPDNIVGSA